jgi:hypothetical protein
MEDSFNTASWVPGYFTQDIWLVVSPYRHPLSKGAAAGGEQPRAAAMREGAEAIRGPAAGGER